MIALILPYLIGAMMGIGSDGTSPKAGARAPEDQTPTGQFTRAAEVKPILLATKSSWVSLRTEDGKDLLYLTHLLAWRCGLWQVSIGINGAAPDQEIPLEPCYKGTKTPNTLTDTTGFPPFLAFGQGQIENVTIRLTFDDGTSEVATFEREGIELP